MSAASRRGPWSPSEDDRLLALINDHGPSNWVRISQLLTTRTPKQCRERYHQNLKPSLNHSPISDEEGILIEHLVAQYGKRWAEIARHLNGRSDNAVKNWWNGGANRRRRASLQMDGAAAHHQQQQQQQQQQQHQHQQNLQQQNLQQHQQQHQPQPATNGMAHYDHRLSLSGAGAPPGTHTHPHPHTHQHSLSGGVPSSLSIRSVSSNSSLTTTPSSMGMSPNGAQSGAGGTAWTTGGQYPTSTTTSTNGTLKHSPPHTAAALPGQVPQFPRYPPIGHRVSLPNIGSSNSYNSPLTHSPLGPPQSSQSSQPPTQAQPPTQSLAPAQVGYGLGVTPVANYKYTYGQYQPLVQGQAQPGSAPATGPVTGPVTTTGPAPGTGPATGTGPTTGPGNVPVIFNAAYMSENSFGAGSKPGGAPPATPAGMGHKRGSSVHQYSPYGRPKENIAPLTPASSNPGQTSFVYGHSHSHSYSHPQHSYSPSQVQTSLQQLQKDQQGAVVGGFPGSRRVSTSSVFSRRSRANSLGSSTSDSEEPFGGSYSLSRYSLSGSVSNSRRNSQIVTSTTTNNNTNTSTTTSASLLPPLALSSVNEKFQPRGSVNEAATTARRSRAPSTPTTISTGTATPGPGQSGAEEVGEKLKISNLLS